LFSTAVVHGLNGGAGRASSVGPDPRGHRGGRAPARRRRRERLHAVWP